MQMFDKVKCQVYSYFADLFLASCSSSHLFLFHNDQAMTQHCPNAVRETRHRRDTVTAILWFHYSVATHPVFRDNVYLWLVTQYCAHTSNNTRQWESGMPIIVLHGNCSAENGAG